MALLPSIDRAIKLFNEATEIATRIGTAVSDGTADVSADTLKDAQERLAGAMQRATTAHDNLEAAIAERLGEKKK